MTLTLHSSLYPSARGIDTAVLASADLRRSSVVEEIEVAAAEELENVIFFSTYESVSVC